MLLVMLAGWVNEEQWVVVRHLKKENTVLQELHGNNRTHSDGGRWKRVGRS